jgi:hypothetical protein
MSVVDPSTAPAAAADPDGPDSVRLSWNTWPQSKVEASRCVVPLAATISPTRVPDPSSPVLCILYVQYCVLLRGGDHISELTEAATGVAARAGLCCADGSAGGKKIILTWMLRAHGNICITCRYYV